MGDTSRVDKGAPVRSESNCTVSVIEDLSEIISGGGSTARIRVAPSAPGLQPMPLISGTAPYAVDWLVKWHSTPHHWPEDDLACYSFADVVVSGSGQIWLKGKLVTSPEVMPEYVANILDVAHGGTDQLHATMRLPIRTIESPCLVAVGHGARVYGHFLVELLFRFLVGELASRIGGFEFKLLLDSDSPSWLLKILREGLGVSRSQIELFDPSTEQVRLVRGYVPTRVLFAEHIHPLANDMLDGLIERLRPNITEEHSRRVFIARNRFWNPAAPKRICVNEKHLIEVARRKFGFTAVSIEELPWEQQISLFHSADIVVGQAGSGLHNALFSRPESRLASIGLMNLVQSEIGALRRQRNAYLLDGFTAEGEFKIDVDLFEAFLNHVCAG